MNAPHWTSICTIDDIYPDSGVCALVDGEQIAIFRVADAVYAIGNHDPASGANVLSRGLVGDIGGELVVASPLFKQHFSLLTGRCLEEPELSVPVYPVRVTEAGAVSVQCQPAPLPAAPTRRKLVVIGNGMAAMRTLEELLELAPQAYDITVFAAEARDTYNRILLSGVLAGDRRAEEIVTHPPDWFERHGIVLHRGDAVVRIDRGTRTVHSRLGVVAPYDRLLIATGSTAVVLPVPGNDLPGVLTFRDLQDVDAMLAVAGQGRRGVVIGGGLLGLEAATGLARQGMQVSVVHLGGILMDRQLDARAAGLLRQDLEGRGLKFCMNAETVAILGGDRVTGVKLADERELPCDLVVMATGIRPNIALAKAAGLRCDRGILVDDTLLTFDPAIYAVGECVQHRATTYGLVAPLWDQARVCAAHLAERGVRRYAGSRVATQLKVSGIKVFSAGDFSERAGRESLVLHDAKRGIYKRLIIEDGRVRGAVLYGETADGTWYFDLMNEGRRVDDLRDQLLFGRPVPAGVATATQ
jgi:NAD(P)H-dependent nitrite reductase small subunit